MLSLLTLYLLGVGSLSLAMGIQIIILPWLAVDALALAPDWVGWIQAAVLIPNLLLLLFAGAVVDRRRGLSVMPLVLGILALAHSTLYLMLNLHWLSFITLFIYAICVGAIQGVIQPWREYLLSQLDVQQLQSVIAKSSLCQYAGQAIGIMAAIFLHVIGIKILLLAQIIIVICAGIFFWCLQRRLATDRSTDNQASNSTVVMPLIVTLRDGLISTWRQPTLRHLIAFISFNGCFHIGVFVVALPLLVRDIYAKDLAFYAGLQLAFISGTIVATIAILRSAEVAFPGRRLLFSLLYSGIILLGISAKPTVVGVVMLTFFWGLVAGVSSNMGRAILQAFSVSAYRGRSISIYQLALFGAAPIGALVAGYAIASIGVLAVLKVSGIISILMFAASLLTKPLWAVESAELRLDKQLPEGKQTCGDSDIK